MVSITVLPEEPLASPPLSSLPLSSAPPPKSPTFPAAPPTLSLASSLPLPRLLSFWGKERLSHTRPRVKKIPGFSTSSRKENKSEKEICWDYVGYVLCDADVKKMLIDFG